MLLECLVGVVYVLGDVGVVAVDPRLDLWPLRIPECASRESSRNMSETIWVAVGPFLLPGAIGWKVGWLLVLLTACYLIMYFSWVRRQNPARGLRPPNPHKKRKSL